MKNKQLTVCVGPRIATPPLLHRICGGGLAPAELHEICVLIPATRGWFKPLSCTYNGGTEIRGKKNT